MSPGPFVAKQFNENEYMSERNKDGRTEERDGNESEDGELSDDDDDMNQDGVE